MEERRGFAAYLLHPTILSTLILLAGYTAYYWKRAAALGKRYIRHHRHHRRVFRPAVAGCLQQGTIWSASNSSALSSMTLTSSVLQLATVLLGAIFFGVSGALAGYAIGQLPMFISTLRIAVAPEQLRRRPLAISSVPRSFLLCRIHQQLDLPEPHRRWSSCSTASGIEAVGFYAVGLSLANLHCSFRCS